MRWPFVSRRERLRREAADWVARLNGPYGENDRTAFERWYRASPDSAEAYDRLAATFRVAGEVRRDETVVQDARGQVRGGTRPVRYALAAAVAAAALLVFVALSAPTTIPGHGVRPQVAAFSSAAGEEKRIVLSDGSELLLSPGSAVDVALGKTERRLRLTRGEARFSVAHEARPFVVGAKGTEVVARGTRFIVRLDAGRTTVSLIQGLVDVSYVEASGGADRGRITRLKAGERLVIERGQQASAPQPVQRRRSQGAPAMLEFDDTPIGEAIGQANSHGGPRIVLADPALARLRVTGAFRAGDTLGFAESLAAAFGLELEQVPGRRLLLRATQGAAQQP